MLSSVSERLRFPRAHWPLAIHAFQTKNYTHKMSLYWIGFLEMAYPFVFLTLLTIGEKEG